MRTVVFVGPEDAARDAQAVLGDGWRVVPARNAAEADAALPEAVAVLDGMMNVPFRASRLALAKDLVVFVAATTGSDHVDRAALEARGIPLLTLKEAKEFLRDITPAAEHTWTLLLACARRLRGATRSVLDGRWERQEFPGILLKGKTLGVIGCGRLGQWMARYARAFGMRVVGHDPFVDPWPPEIERASFDEVLVSSHFVTVHVHLSDSTRGILGPNEFAKMRDGVVVLNTSRGAIIDESALLAALESGKVAAAGLDVLDGEPDTARHPLVEYARRHDNLVITPHVAGYAPDAFKEVVRFSAGRILRHFEEASPRART